ncbi:MAG: hypothetical protein KDK99_14385 [Verrucomicrobiales bacterium]|nr:hypothetical protein [Verrucomicrobiales bacterium]
MSFRLEMLQVARVAPKLLGESAELVERFLRARQLPSGGFADREGKPDLYYSVFGLEGLMALQADPPWEAMRQWLTTFGDGEGLDFVHLGCLARCWASVGGDGLTELQREKLAQRMEAFRTPDGGYHQALGKQRATAYGCLLGWSLHQDLGREAPEETALIACLEGLRAADGAFSNERNQPFGLVPATAAAVSLLRHLGRPIPEGMDGWLREQAHPEGGFRAFPGVPIPDLLSTAVALHALDGLQAGWEDLREPCLDFIDSLWNAEGGFHGNWLDDELDCEYTYYGLLSLGHLAV